MNNQRKKHFMKKFSEKLGIPHFWCSFSKKENKFLRKLSIYLCPMRNEIEAKTMLELDAMIDAYDDAKINVESTLFTKKELKIMSKAFIDSLASCASCVVKYKEFMKMNKNDDTKFFFEEIEQKRCKQGLENTNSHLVTFEILYGNWEFIADCENRAIWYKKIKEALNDKVCPVKYTFSITCMLLGDEALYKYASAIIFYFFETDYLFLHTTYNEWNFLLKTYNEFLYHITSEEVVELNMLEFVYTYILVEGTYVNDDIVKLLSLHYHETKDEEVKIKIFSILICLNKKTRLLDDAVKTIAIDITETVLFQEYIKKNYIRKKDEHMIRFDVMDYIVESFTLFCNFGLEELILEVFSGIIDKNYFDKALNFIIENIQNITNVTDFMRNSIFFTKTLELIFLKHMHKSADQNKNRIFIKKCANITVQNTYKIFDTNEYTDMFQIYYAWNNNLMHIQTELKDDEKCGRLCVFFEPFIEMFFYDISSYFAKHNANFFALYSAYKQNVLSLFLSTNYEMKLNVKNEVYKNFITNKTNLFLHLDNTKIMLGHIVKFIDTYEIQLANIDLVIDYVVKECFDFDIFTSLLYLTKYTEISAQIMNNYINKINTNIPANEINRFLSLLRIEKCDAEKVKIHFKVLYKKVKNISKETKNHKKYKKLLKNIKKYFKSEKTKEKVANNEHESEIDIIENDDNYNNTNSYEEEHPTSGNVKSEEYTDSINDISEENKITRNDVNEEYTDSINDINEEHIESKNDVNEEYTDSINDVSEEYIESKNDKYKLDDNNVLSSANKDDSESDKTNKGNIEGRQDVNDINQKNTQKNSKMSDNRATKIINCGKGMLENEIKIHKETGNEYIRNSKNNNDANKHVQSYYNSPLHIKEKDDDGTNKYSSQRIVVKDDAIELLSDNNRIEIVNSSCMQKKTKEDDINYITMKNTMQDKYDVCVTKLRNLPQKGQTKYNTIKTDNIDSSAQKYIIPSYSSINNIAKNTSSVQNHTFQQNKTQTNTKKYDSVSNQIKFNKVAHENAMFSNNENEIIRQRPTMQYQNRLIPIKKKCEKVSDTTKFIFNEFTAKKPANNVIGNKVRGIKSQFTMQQSNDKNNNARDFGAYNFLESNLLPPRKRIKKDKMIFDYQNFYNLVLTNKTHNSASQKSIFEFESLKDYQNHFEPLLMNEIHANIEKESKNYKPFTLSCFTVEKVTVDFSCTELVLSHGVGSNYQENDCIFIRNTASELKDKTLAIVKSVDQVKNNYYLTVMLKTKITQYEKNQRIEHSYITNINTFLREYQAIYNLEEFLLKDHLLKPSTITNNDEKLSQESVLSIKNKLKINESQAEAVLKCIDYTKKFILIQGPPGTGKTTTILSILSAFFSEQITFGRINEKSRVLICAPSNTAIDEVARRVIKDKILTFSGDKINTKIIRVGTAANMCNTIKNISLEFLLEQLNCQTAAIKNQMRIKLLEEADIVFTTLSSSALDCLSQKNLNLDLLIVDEACQCVETSCIIPFKHNPKKIILIGDPKQLPPTTISNSNLYEFSLFQRFSRFLPISLLKIQYRMTSEIAAYPNARFYNLQLKTDEHCDTRMNIYKNYINCVNFINVKGCEIMNKSFGYYNEIEAKCVVNLVELLSQKIPIDKNIAIISPYKAQVGCITDLFTKNVNCCKFISKICINTVDAFQGQEKDLVIISMVRTNKIGFVNDKRRLNVSLTRAKFGVVIFGNRNQLSEDAIWRELIQFYTKQSNYWSESQFFSHLRYKMSTET